MKKMTFRLILAAVLVAAWGMQSPARAAGFTVTDLGTFANNGTDVTAPPAFTVGTSSITGSATGENSTTAGGTTISEAFTAPSAGMPYDVVTALDFYTNSAFTGITGWTVSIEQIAALTGTETVLSTQTLTASATQLGSNSQTGTSGIYVQITPGSSNYLQLTAGDDYVITVGTTGGTFTPQTTSTTAAGITAGTLNTSGTSFSAATGNFTFFVDTVPVPEPTSWWVMAVAGTLAFVAFRRFRGGVLA